jgi:hypothetical protein
MIMKKLHLLLLFVGIPFCVEAMDKSERVAIITKLSNKTNVMIMGDDSIVTFSIAQNIKGSPLEAKIINEVSTMNAEMVSTKPIGDDWNEIKKGYKKGFFN